MPAYIRLPLPEFIAADVNVLLGRLQTCYASDGYASQYTKLTASWASILPKLQDELRRLPAEAATWAILLEFPLYRLRKRLDAVILAGSLIVVLEVKVGETAFRAEDLRQVEEYALDLRDFHAGSRDRRLLPVLWCTGANAPPVTHCQGGEDVAAVHRVGNVGLSRLLGSLVTDLGAEPIVAEVWDQAIYSPVPTVIEAATTIFAGHDVRAIAQADASNLRHAAKRLVELIDSARRGGRRALLFLTGVPGSGKTLAGLQVVHDAVTTGAGQVGDIVYLSGNTPLVTVLREALAQDEYRRSRAASSPRTLDAVRRDVRTRIQHINDFLRGNLTSGATKPPHEHAIVFDEAQRAWDIHQGKKKFDRSASEPTLLLEIMNRHRDWCACVCLVGGGQEINTGEQGVHGWGEALRRLAPEVAAQWDVHASADVLRGGESTAGQAIGKVPTSVTEEPALQLLVPMRSFRSQAVSAWVARVLEGQEREAASLSRAIGRYPIRLTRSLTSARSWLRERGRGLRQYGLVASSGGRRLRAEGLGQVLEASDGNYIGHWYLQLPGDIRSSCALEVPANEYTCQGLELAFVGVCWGGDLVRDPKGEGWVCRSLGGSRWKTIQNVASRQLLINSYRVLLTRAREGMVLYVPVGCPDDATRDPSYLDATADYLVRCGATPV